MPNSSPAALLQNSISSFSTSALNTLKDLEKQLAQAATDACDAQKERDGALKLNREAKLQLSTHTKDVLAYKASLVQAELTMDSQREIITSLQREVTHWKEQARNWQEHFTRVEEERCSLSTKLDEILTTQTFEQIVPTHLLETGTIKRAAVAGYFPSPNVRSNDGSKSVIEDAEVVESPALAWKPTTGSRTAAQHSTKSAHAGEPRRSDVHVSSTTSDQSLNPPPSRLVRRVQAVVHVKAEEEEEEALKRNDKQEVTLQPTKIKQRRVPRKSKRIVPQDDEDWSPSREDGSHPIPAVENGSASDEDDELILRSLDTQANAVPPNKKRRLNNSRRQSKKS